MSAEIYLVPTGDNDTRDSIYPISSTCYWWVLFNIELLLWGFASQSPSMLPGSSSGYALIYMPLSRLSLFPFFLTRSNVLHRVQLLEVGGQAANQER